MLTNPPSHTPLSSTLLRGSVLMNPPHPTPHPPARRAVLVAGSRGYSNYRHHADLCHAYQLLSGAGVDPAHIITFLFDDVAKDPANPFPGQLFNKPAAGEGVDVYAGCKKSYTGVSATAANLLAVLTGNASQVRGGSGEVLLSSPSSNVFFSFFDHGGAGLVAMPVGPYLYADDLLAAFARMGSSPRLFRRLVVYMEACESGSMFVDLPTDTNIFAVSAAAVDEPSYGTYCPPDDDSVNGTSLGTCLGDLYSVSWLEDTEKYLHNRTSSSSSSRSLRAAASASESLEQQYETVRNETVLSHVMQWGDQSWTGEDIADFQSGGSAAAPGPGLSRPRGTASSAFPSPFPSLPAHLRSPTSSRFATLLSLRARAAKGSASAQAELALELRAASVASRAFGALAADLLGDAPDANPVHGPLGRITQWPCYKAAVQAAEGEGACGRFTDLTLMYARTLARVCEAVGPALGAEAVAARVRGHCEAAVAETAA